MENNNETTESRTTPEIDENSDLSTVSDEDLDAALAASQIEEESFSEEEDQEDQDGEEKSDSSELDPDNTKESEESKTAEKTRKDSEAQEDPSENEKLKRELAQQQEFINRQKNEIGKARKEARDAKEKLEQHKARIAEAIRNGDLDSNTLVDLKLKEKELDSKIEAVDEDIAELDYQDEALDQRENAKQYLAQKIDPKHWNVNGMVAVLKNDGATDEEVSQFVRDPYAIDPTWTYQLHRRTVAEAAAIQLHAYVQKLQKEIDELKSKPDNGLKTLEKNLKEASSSINKSSERNRFNDKKTITDSDISKLSDDDLERALQAANSA